MNEALVAYGIFSFIAFLFVIAWAVDSPDNEFDDGLKIKHIFFGIVALCALPWIVGCFLIVYSFIFITDHIGRLGNITLSGRKNGRR